MMRIVSIHAPARGATRSRHCLRSEAGCFNPRAREGRDGGNHAVQGDDLRFNPRAREGRDDFRVTSARRAGVSIHAPARGATGIH